MTTATARLVLTTVCGVLISTVFTACQAGGYEGRMPGHAKAPILLFGGAGTSPGDVEALETILHHERLPYAMANSAQLNGMTEAQIRQYRQLIVPGGNFEQIGNGLTSSTASTIHHAIQHGLNYLGICAGAFFAGKSPSNGLTSGSRFAFYAAEARGTRKAAVPITSSEGQTLDQYWEDSPQLAGRGAVVGKYPNGTPAIVEGTFGDGWVILIGVHPEAPASWRRGMDFRTPVDRDNAYAARLIRAALNREWLPHY